jgi:hypothetical protein
MLDEMYSSRTRVRSVNTRITLATTRKGTSTMADYYNKMKSQGGNMAASGQPLGDEEFVTYILAGLDEEIYNSLVSSIVTKVEPISSAELYSQMLSFELCLNKQTGDDYSSANVVSHGRGPPWSRGGSEHSICGRGRGRGGGRGSSPGMHGGYSNKNTRAPCYPSDVGSSRPCCQVCMKVGHTAATYWYRYDEDYVPDNWMAAMHLPLTSIQIGILTQQRPTTSLMSLNNLPCMRSTMAMSRSGRGADMDIVHVGKTF